MGGVERKGAASVGSGATGGDRRSSCKLVDLARELSSLQRGDGGLVTKAVPADNVDCAVHDQPSRRVLLANGINCLMSRERPEWTADKASRCLDLRGIELWKYLVLARARHGHDEVHPVV